MGQAYPPFRSHRASHPKERSRAQRGVSIRPLVYARTLIAKGVDPRDARSMTLVRPITDAPDMRDTLDSAVSAFSHKKVRQPKQKRPAHGRASLFWVRSA